MRALILGPAAVLGAASSTAVASASPAQAGPTCTPATLNNAALQHGSVTISPLSGSRVASPRTQISFRGAPAAKLSAVSVVGSRTGRHGGRLAAYSQGDGASFLPARPFAQGERVTVRARLHASGASVQLLDRFAIAREDPITSTPEAIHPGSASEVQGFRSRPDLHPPAVSVTTSLPGAAPGEAFVAPYTGPGQAGPMILDQSGRLVWFKPLPTHVFAANFQVQRYAGKPVLTWWQGDISVHGFGLGEDEIFDASYSPVARVRAGNGHRADLHEFQLSDRGTALLTAYDPVLCDLSAWGGPARGAVTNGIVQEIDVKTGLVRYEWTSLDHVSPGTSHERARRSTTSTPFDFFHINSINLDSDGSLLISARNTWAIYDIDGPSGRINWQLGGRQSDFKTGAGTSTAWQHDPRLLGNGTISIFDNGASPAVRGQSRGIVLRLDPVHRQVTLLSQLTHVPALLSDSQGNMQALANGDWFLGWGQVPYFSEYGPDGTLLFDAHFPAHTQSYRSFRFTWTGTPAHRPTFVLQPGSGLPTVYASWNGATEVASWVVLAGRAPASLAPVAQAQRSGFETAIQLPAGTAGPYLAVQALDSSERVLATSPAVQQPGL